MKFLIFDNDEPIRLLISMSLEPHQSLHALNGEQGLATLLENPDTNGIFLDYKMGMGMNGCDVSKAIRQDPKYAAFNNIFIAGTGIGFADDVSKREFLTIYLPKPISPSVIRDAVKRYLGE